ncbi:MAG: RnfABCDGE type electron transport complex subunit D [Jaaginema sp. PMC 1079.18]|nr:RnfABCDGE type electron transport complex subunit D [Jaaginema sp. PMC 1080.18]MEC4851345.1 RnfABCDGE type electron transport complex subunit D [Jaaginema sp. PMC 1079.18]MEC4864703.1 RnfABCDGE type electron transport complex subunit D [Jaaginema sp. PMC 1078.18]
MFQDARDYQILFLSSFLILGISTRDWTIHPQFLLVIVLTCLLTQWFFTSFLPFWESWWRGESPANWALSRFQFSISSAKSALITALGLCLLLRANDAKTMAIAAFLAIASKFLFRYSRKHFFNPANFGIIAALLLTQDAWVSPGQWGTDWWYLLLFLGAGGMVLNKVGRWDTSAAFLGAYGGLEALRNLWLGQAWDVYWHHLTSGSLLLFALFMLTDPRSIPNARLSRLLWALSIAGVAFFLEHTFYLNNAIFWALFVISPLTIVGDRLWSAPRFEWKTFSVISNQ